MGVAGDGDELQAVAEGQGELLDVVGGADEEDFGEVVGEGDVVVHEGGVLGRVQDL